MENLNSLDYHENLDEQSIGAKVLSSANFQESNKGIVESSFNKAIKRGEKLPGKNTERRNIAYLERLQGMIDKYGDKFEKKVWERTIDSLIIKPTEITDDYWKTQEQILRDDGQGRKLSSSEKEILVEDIQKHQRESLESWTNYLSHEDCPYPTWFKVYTMNGISKMGVFDKSKSIFKKRDNTSVAPYPHLNQATLAKVYDTITDFYNVDADKDLAGAKDVPSDETESARNAELDALVKSGNFNKLYSKLLLSEKMIMKTPERTEDIHGEWVEYGLGDEDAIASAADGTPWCVASPSVGRSYLTTGEYGDNYNDDYDNTESKAKFILFHLYNEDGRLADNACASIRLDTDGDVAEISGLNDGQALEDSLVPIVEERVRSLPGGDNFLRRFADKRKLIELDRKMQGNEDLTKEELEFLYEINRPIETLDTYNRVDPRIPELKEKYGIEYALDAGIDANRLVPKMCSQNVANNLDTLIQHGANIDVNQLVSEIDSWDVANNLDTLIQHGANIDNLVSKLYAHHIAGKLDTLIDHGANIDNLVSKLDSGDIVANLDTIINHGANIDNLVSKLYAYHIAEKLDTLIDHGANIDNLVSKLYSGDIVANLDTIINHGANIDNLVSKLSSYDIAHYLDTIINHGINIDTLVSKLSSYDIAYCLDTLINHGANIDIDALVSELDPYYIAENLDTLIDHGANIDALISELDPYDIVENLDTIINHGINIDTLVSKLSSYDIAENLDTLINHGANIDNLVSKLCAHHIAEKLDTLINHGANIDTLVSGLDPDDIAKNLDTLRRHGWNG